MISIEALEKQLKDNKLNSMYLLYGEETFLLETCLKKIKHIFGELVKGINYIEIDDTNFSELIQDLETPAFGFNKKLIVVKNVGLFKREVKKKGATFAETRELLEKYIKENKDIIKESVILVFIEESVDKIKLLNTVEEFGAVVCNFEYQKPAQIIARLKGICKAYNVNVEESTLKYLIEGSLTGMQDLINEIRKQIEYAGSGGTITKESIDLLAVKQIDSVIFDLTDNLGKKNIKEALIILNNLIYAKEPLQKILITLYNHFKKIYIVKLAMEQNRNVTEALNLKPNQTFLVNKYRGQSNFFSKDELKSILDELIKLDSNYKVGLIDLKVGLESILCRYCS